MTDPTDLLTFLRARYDEDERLVHAYVAALPGIPASMVPDSEPAGVYGEFERRFSDPATTLADIGAKRAVLDLHGIIWRDIGWLEYDEGEWVEASAELPVCVYCVPRHSSFRTRDEVPQGPCQTVRRLATAYAAHSDYRDEWTP